MQMLPANIEESLRELDIEVPECSEILLVDDELENLDVLAALLEKTWKVFTAASGPDALDFLHTHGPVDLIIADQRMPEMTGVELLQRIADEHPDIVRIVLTAYGDLEPMVDAINKGAVYRFLFKPFDPLEIRAIVKDCMTMRASAVALRHVVEALEDRRGQLDSTLSRLWETQEQLLVAERKAALGSVTSGIVHELRNLSTSLAYLTDRIQKTSHHPVLIEVAKRTRVNLSSLLELLEQVRAFACSSSVEVKRKPVPAYAFFGATVELFGMEDVADKCPVRIQVDTDTKRLNIDPARMRQALIALLRNAALASEPDLPVVVSVRPGLEPGSVLVEVQDLGCGMDDTVRGRAREPFFSAFDPPGMGLGLEIAGITAEAHGGRFELASTPGKGTRATIWLPGVIPDFDVSGKAPPPKVSPEPNRKPGFNPDEKTSVGKRSAK